MPVLIQALRASANLYSLIETSKANGLEPYAYLKRVFAELPNATSFDDVDQLLPENIHSATKEEAARGRLPNNNTKLPA